MTNPTNPGLAPFKPTPDMMTAAENLFLSMALEQTIRPIVEGYQRKILAERMWEVDPELVTAPGIPEHINDIKSTWLMSTVDFAAYFARCNEERIAANLQVERGDYCPLLVAENTTRLARQALCDSIATVTKIDGETAAALPAADYDHLVDITLKLLAPFVTNPLAKYKSP